MIRILLVSPLDPNTPGNLKYLMGGENTYTRTLLSHPPKGVIYTHHLDALKQGLLEYLPLQKFLSTLVKSRILPMSSGSQCFKIKGKFDLVHCHGYSIKIVGSKIPIVISDSSSNYLFLRDYLNWPKWRIKAGYRLRRLLFNKLDVIDCDTNWQGAEKIIVFSKFTLDVHRQLGVPKNKIIVISPGLPIPHTPNTPHPKINILFVGIWFERKGGPLLLEAVKKLFGKYPSLRLTIVGPVPKNIKYQISNIKYYDYVPREKLMREIFPKADILVLVPPKAEGFGFVVLEAMSFGIAQIVTDVYALPELVKDGQTGFVIAPGNLDQLVEKLELLISNPKKRQKMGESARKVFGRRFSVEIMQKKLVEIYTQNTPLQSIATDKRN